MSRNPLANEFGKKLKTTIIHLVKNDGPCAQSDPAVETAKLFEAFRWDELTDAERKARVDAVYAAFGPGSPVARHYENYPHHYSRDQYAEFCQAMDAYRATL